MTQDGPGTKVALYVRVSGEEQKQGHNIDSQIAELRQFASQRGWFVYAVYSDEAWSGAALARPALDKLRDDAGKKLFDAVLINDVDRLARDVTHLGVIKRDLERSGVRVVFRKIPSENSPTHNLLVNILGSFAEFERELIMDRTRRGRRHKVEARQEFIGCVPPYGYRYVPRDHSGDAGRLSLNHEEAAIVRQMYSWVDSLGLSTRGVMLRLAAEGIRPRKGATTWGKSSVTRILRSSIYRGTWYYNKLEGCYPRGVTRDREARSKKSSTRIRSRDEWIPVALPDQLRIVSPDQWQRVQEQLDRNRSFSPRNSKHEYLLSGLVQCGGCGSRYVGNPSHGRFQYRCIKRCKMRPMISERILDSHVWHALERALNNPELLMRAISGIAAPVTSEDEIGQVESGLRGVQAEEERVLEAYRLNILTPEQLATQLSGIAGRRQVLEKQRTSLADRRMQAVSGQTSVEDSCRVIRQSLGKLTFQTKRRVLRLLLRRVTFEGDLVRIAGILPLAGVSCLISPSIDSSGIENGGIATTEVDHPDRNLVAEFSLLSRILR